MLVKGHNTAQNVVHWAKTLNHISVCPRGFLELQGGNSVEYCLIQFIACTPYLEIFLVS